MNYLFRCSRLKHLTVWHRTPHQLYYYHCTATMADWFKASLAPTKALFVDEDSTDEIPFQSRRSPFLCRHACVSTSQPLASSIGLDFLRAGKGNSSKEANAADVAVAVAAALAVTEPCSTGLGGDMFCLYYDAEKRTVSCINGSGRSPAELSLELLKEKFPIGTSDDSENNDCDVDVNSFRTSAAAVTVPGAARGWEDLLQTHGSGNYTMRELLQPAVELAEDGFPVAGPVTSFHWKAGLDQIKSWLDPEDIEQGKIPLTVDGRSGPETGDIMVNKDMGRVLRDLGTHGATSGFYEGQTGQAIVDAVQKHGGYLTMQDLIAHSTSEFPPAIFSEYRGHQLWQCPPNGQGIAGLIALAGLKQLEDAAVIDPLSADTIGKPDHIHALVEMMRLGFADARAYVADPESMAGSGTAATKSVEELMDSDRIGQRAQNLFDPNEATIEGIPDASSCTVSFQVVDGQGNAISFVNSNYMGFGTGIVPENCGFTLQNRGFGFTLKEDHPNAVGPSKRPYHTIIPGMLTHADTGELYATISNMGGNMQPQGHLQLSVSLLAAGLDPQAAIDMPRFCIADGTSSGAVFLEEGTDEKTVLELMYRGHEVKAKISGHERAIFGRAQIIKRDRKTGVLWAGSDGRADGCAMGF